MRCMVNVVLKRVPMDFDWPLKKVWHGYVFTRCENCDDCIMYARIKGLKISETTNCPVFDTEPPTGPGYQMWETTTEGSPCSPVFATFDELCEWCAENESPHGSTRFTAEQWKECLADGDTPTTVEY